MTKLEPKSNARHHDDDDPHDGDENSPNLRGHNVHFATSSSPASAPAPPTIDMSNFTGLIP